VSALFLIASSTTYNMEDDSYIISVDFVDISDLCRVAIIHTFSAYSCTIFTYAAAPVICRYILCTKCEYNNGLMIRSRSIDNILIIIRQSDSIKSLSFMV